MRSASSPRITSPKKASKHTAKQIEKMRQDDKDFIQAVEDSMAFLENKKKAVAKISRGYHLEMEELFQEGYEVLLTCIRDFNPIYERADGSIKPDKWMFSLVSPSFLVMAFKSVFVDLSKSTEAKVFTPAFRFKLSSLLAIMLERFLGKSAFLRVFSAVETQKTTEGRCRPLPKE